MGYSHFNQYGSDEIRAVEGIAAEVDLTPRLPDENDNELARRMADWSVWQGPNVRWSAVYFAALEIVDASHTPGIGFTELTEVGIHALRRYNAIYS